MVETLNAHETLQLIAEGDLSLLKTMKNVVESSFQEANLDPETFVLLRIAALAALDAAPASWLANLKTAHEMDIDPQRVVGTIIAIAPVIGTARVVSAASSAAKAMALNKVRERMR